jgi:hypothetical protein
MWQQVDSALCRLLFLETDIGMNFAHVAVSADSTREGLHNRQLARRAYDNAERWMSRATLTRGEKKMLCGRMQCLREALRGLGDPALQPGKSGKKIQSIAEPSLDNRPQF